MTRNSLQPTQGNMESPNQFISLHEYMQKIAPTDRLSHDNLRPVLMGLFGEVGSIMATAKKLYREKKAYAGFQNAVEEEFGDALWYFTALCRRLNFKVDEIISYGTNEEEYDKTIFAADLVEIPVSHVSSQSVLTPRDEVLIKLGESVTALFRVIESKDNVSVLLQDFADNYEQALRSVGIPFLNVVQNNFKKACGRFLDPVHSALKDFDQNFLDEERLPRHFEIKITERKNGQSYLQWKGVFIGDPLTDNIFDPDGYRYHDVFHFAYAAILHWSPTFRALIKQKRKSDPKIDEAQDGGRAIVVEEGLSAWIFSRAKELDFFEGQDSISFDMLKAVQQFVQGYEVDTCPLKLWEKAILDGYAVFRQVRENKGGLVIGDRDTRSITYSPIGGSA